MHETLKYWLVACWLIFLFIPLLAAIIITALIGVAGIWGIICYWIVPSTIYARKEICRFNQAKEELGEMRNAFGEGATVVNVITGRRIRL